MHYLYTGKRKNSVQNTTFFTDYLNKKSKGNLIILKHFVYSVSNFWPLGHCQETNNWINFVSYISFVNRTALML